MREAVRAMRRAISPRLAIRRVVIGVVGVVLSAEEVEEVVIAAVAWLAGGRIRGAEEGRRGREARRRWWVRLRERIVELASRREQLTAYFEMVSPEKRTRNGEKRRGGRS
jgi:hypothetical protein